MATYYATLLDKSEVIATSNGKQNWIKFAYLVEDLLIKQGQTPDFDVYESETGRLVCSYSAVDNNFRYTIED